MNKTLKKYIRVTALPTLFIVGTFAVSMLLSDDKDPYNPMPLGQFFLIKFIAIILVLACYVTAKYLSRKDLIDIPTEEDKDNGRKYN